MLHLTLHIGCTLIFPTSMRSETLSQTLPAIAFQKSLLVLLYFAKRERNKAGLSAVRKEKVEMSCKNMHNWKTLGKSEEIMFSGEEFQTASILDN